MAGPTTVTRKAGTLTERECERARRILMRRDRRLAVVIRRAGKCRLFEGRTRDPFVSLVRALVSQQLSGKAAATIFGRVATLAGGVDRLAPAAVLVLDPTALRQAGLSRQKIAYIRDLSERVADGRLALADLERLSDEEVMREITAVKGFGRWSAEMFLMFRLNRPDIFPVGDLGVAKGVQTLLGMKGRPSVRTMERAAEAWRPYRSVAAWYLWRIHD